MPLRRGARRGPRSRRLVDDVGAVVPSPGRARPPPGVRAGASTPACRCSPSSTWRRGGTTGRVVAITGTDGKTTVTELVRAMLEPSGRRAVAVGNTEVPLVAAIDDPTVDVFVVEASSFRLLHSHHFAPDVGTWLNLAPDHLDPAAWAATPPSTTTSPPRRGIWKDQSPDQVAIGNADDPVVAAELASAPGPPGHVRAGAVRRQPRSTATASCSTPATSLAERRRAAPRRSPTTSPTRWPPPPPPCTAGPRSPAPARRCWRSGGSPTG